MVRMLATLLRPDAGYALVCGADIVQRADRVRELIGLTGQYPAVDEDLTGSVGVVSGCLSGSARKSANATLRLAGYRQLKSVGRPELVETRNRPAGRERIPPFVIQVPQPLHRGAPLGEVLGHAEPVG